MKLNEIIDLNKPQIKVEMHAKRGGDPRLLLIQDISSENVPEQIKEIIQRIAAKYVDGKARLKLISQNPVVFNVVPADGKDFFRFSISFPVGMDDVQKGLITSISNFKPS